MKDAEPKIAPPKIGSRCLSSHAIEKNGHILVSDSFSHLMLDVTLRISENIRLL
jgi:hypothetical protein